MIRSLQLASAIQRRTNQAPDDGDARDEAALEFTGRSTESSPKM
jgi:hypothetical protein